METGPGRQPGRPRPGWLTPRIHVPHGGRIPYNAPVQKRKGISYLNLLGALVGLYAVATFVRPDGWGILVVDVSFLAVIGLAHLTLESRGWLRRITIAVLAFTIAITVVHELILFDLLLVPGSFELSVAAIQAVLIIVLLGTTIAGVLHNVLGAAEENADLVWGGVCTYLLLGMVFASIFTLTEVNQPGSFSLPDKSVTPDEARQTGTYLYFSLVTLSTLGYGDITPLTKVTRMTASFEALLGQVFLAVLVGRLVATHMTRRRSTDVK